MVIDLHTHSSASDGTDTPAELMGLAAAAGLTTVALTDHDTTAGWAEATAALPSGLTLVPGIEISAVWNPPTGWPIPLHLLGYLVDPGAGDLQDELAAVRASRIDRARLMVERMAADGLPVTWPQVQALAGTGTVGRPHLARALLASGVVSSVNEAFAGPVSSRSPYYVPKADIDVLHAITLVRAAGGVPVFAHPLRRGRTLSDDAIAELAAGGLVALEADHPDHSSAQRDHLRGVAGELGLLVTGSSDYHGTNKTTPLAARTTDPDVFAELVSRSSHEPVVG